MSLAVVSPRQVRAALIARTEIALVDVRDEADFATGHPLFAAQVPPDRIEIEAGPRWPRRDAPIVLYGDEAEAAAARFRALGYSAVFLLDGGLGGWRDAGYELFEDVNSYAKAFGELVEHRRGTPSLPAEEVQALIDDKADIAILDARRFDEYATMSLPGGVSVPGAELVLRAPAIAPDPATTIVVNCAGRTRSIIGAQSLINAGLPNRVVALRNGTIGWTLAGQTLAHGSAARFPEVGHEIADEARARARNVAYRAGVRQIDRFDYATLAAERGRTLYRFDVRTPEEYAAGHLPGFRSAPGGQLVQEIDHFAPVRGARIVLADDRGARADMTASWLAQMGWDVLVLASNPLPPEGGGPEGVGGRAQRSALHFGDTASSPSVTLRAPPLPGGGGLEDALPPRGPHGRYRRPYEGADHPAAAMQAYLDWEYGLVAQLARDGAHGFFVI